MTCSLAQRAGTAACPCPKSLKSWAFADHRLFDKQGVHLKLGVVFGIRDRAFEGLLYQYSRFFWTECQKIERIRSGTALNFARNFARLESRNTRKPICRCHLHCFFTSKCDAPYFATLAVCAPCFLKDRVGENSPSLCPTIFSVTNTELNILPLCTRNVCPTKSGVIIERRDQVLIGFLEAPELIFSIFWRSFISTKGPFFSDLPIGYFVFFLCFRCSTMKASLGLCLRRV